MSYASTVYGVVNTIGFLLHSMAKRKIIFFPKLLNKINKNGKPYMAFFTQLFFAFCFLTLINQKIVLISITNLGFIFTQLLVAASIFVIFMHKKNYKESIVPIATIISCLILGYYSFLCIGTILNIIPFLILLAIGLISYKFQTRKNAN